MCAPANEDEESRLSTNGFSYQDLLQIVDLIKTSEQFNEFHLKVGDIVLFGKWSGTEVKLDGEDLLIMKESDIMGVLN